MGANGKAARIAAQDGPQAAGVYRCPVCGKTTVLDVRPLSVSCTDHPKAVGMVRVHETRAQAAIRTLEARNDLIRTLEADALRVPPEELEGATVELSELIVDSE